MEKGKEKEQISPLNVDEMLESVGDFGKFQIMLMALFSIMNALSAFHYFGQTFVNLEPEFTCRSVNFDMSYNYTNSELSKCGLKLTLNDNTTITQPCTSWEYNDTYGYISLVQELNWVCQDDWKSALGQSVFFIGSLIGTLVFGILADRIGRLHVLVIANVLAFIGNITTIFSYDVKSYGLSRFVAGFATDANFVMMYMLVMEYIRPSMRTFGLNLTIGVFYCAFSILVPWTAVFAKNWRYFLIIIAVPHLLVLLYYLVVPESAQWLISKGKMEKALKAYRRIAKINGKVVTDKNIEGLKLYAKENIRESVSHSNFLNLLQTPKLRKKTLILILKSMILNLCYDAIARNVNGLNYSPFIIFSATSATILPGCIIILLLQDRIGRKALASSSLFLGGIFISIAGIILASHDAKDATLTLILTVIARLNVIVAFNSGSQYAFELIPTEVRAQGVSVMHVAGFAATFFSPHVLYLVKIWKPLPELCIGFLLITGAIACLFLPETLNKTLPVTLQDGEEFGEDEHLFEFSCCGRANTESTFNLTGSIDEKNRYNSNSFSCANNGQ